MNRIHPNPHIKVSGVITGSQMQWMLFVIKETTGLKYGYMPNKMVDTGIISATLTLCKNGSKRIAWSTLSHVETAIKAFGIGQGFGMIKVTWDDEF